MKKKKQSKPKNKPLPKAPKAAARGMGTPYADRVLVKPTPAQETTSFGLIIPDTSKEKPEQGVVVAVGPGRRGEDGKMVPMNVKVGDRIMFSKYGYEEIKINGTDYYLIQENSITYVF